MGAISAKLDQLEARLQTLIEGRLARLLPGQESRADLIRRLVAAMKMGTQQQPDGSSIAPDTYALLAHPDRAQRLVQNQQLLQGLAAAIHEAGNAAGLRFASQPAITVSPNSDLQREEIIVIPRTSEEALSQTIETEMELEADPNGIPANAFLIVNGVETFSLEQPLINIGRRSTNDLVIDDPRISRHHAQLRAIRGKYVLFDLDSKGGTLMNGQRITQCVIHPRDVISLAGIPLVYGQEDTDLGKTHQMAPSPPSGEDHPTKDSQI